MGDEIERKWIVYEEPPFEFEAYDSEIISQGYLNSRNENLEVRIRRKGENYFYTKKEGSGLERKEFEFSISQKSFEIMWPLTSIEKGGLGRIEKTRYDIPNGNGHLIEFDMYHGSLEGKMVAEVEFDSVKESNNFHVPEWFGREVTDDRRYSNASLALNGWPED